MSNALAIATVTATLRDLLEQSIRPPAVGGGAAPPGPAGPFANDATVTHLAPDDSKLTGADVPATVNIFLYQVVPNPSWRNADLPTRRPDGSLLRRPQVALDLHYLLSCYGSNATLEPQRLLGVVVRRLHANPVLTRDQIAASLKPPALPFLNQPLRSDLPDQIELIRFTPIHFSLEEMSKLWSVFLKTDYALSVAYSASVVLIDTDDPLPAAAPPVLTPVVFATPLEMPVIDALDPPMPEFSPALKVTLIGRNLNTPGNIVRIDELDVDLTPDAASTNTALIVTLPGGLTAGVHHLRIVQQAPLPADHVASESGPAFLVLRPKVSVAFAADTFTATVQPPVGIDQKVFLVLNQIGVAASPATFTLPATVRTTAADPVTFARPTTAGPATLPSGTYLARIRVDDAESLLSGVPYSDPHVVVP